MRIIKSLLAGLIRHTVCGLYYAATVVAMAAAYYILRAYGVWAGWVGVVGVLLVSLGWYVVFFRRCDPTESTAPRFSARIVSTSSDRVDTTMYSDAASIPADMAQLSAASLLTLIQMVDRELGALRKAVQDRPGTDYLSEMHAYTTAADELADAYIEATRNLSNFPAYEELVKNLD